MGISCIRGPFSMRWKSRVTGSRTRSEVVSARIVSLLGSIRVPPGIRGGRNCEKATAKPIVFAVKPRSPPLRIKCNPPLRWLPPPQPHRQLTEPQTGSQTKRESRSGEPRPSPNTPDPSCRDALDLLRRRVGPCTSEQLPDRDCLWGRGLGRGPR